MKSRRQKEVFSEKLSLRKKKECVCNGTYLMYRTTELGHFSEIRYAKSGNAAPIRKKNIRPFWIRCECLSSYRPHLIALQGYTYH